MAVTTFYHQIAANRRNSFLMAAFVVAAPGACSASPSATPCSAPRRRVVTTGVALAFGSLAGIGTYFAGDSSCCRSVGARQVDETRRPQLMNVVRELAHRGQHPDARGLRHRRHGAQRLRDRPRPGARLDRDHDRPAREARSRGAPGRHRPRARRTSATSTSGSRSSSACMVGAIAILADFFLRFTFWGGGRGRDRDSGGGGGGPGHRLRRRASSWRSWRRSSAASSSSRSAASASTSPTPRPWS